LSIVGCGGFGPANVDVLTIVRAAAKAPVIVATTAIFDFMRGVLSNTGGSASKARTDVFIAKQTSATTHVAGGDGAATTSQ
jgi:hypothetical protein